MSPECIYIKIDESSESIFASEVRLSHHFTLFISELFTHTHTHINREEKCCASQRNLHRKWSDSNRLLIYDVCLLIRYWLTFKLTRFVYKNPTTQTAIETPRTQKQNKRSKTKRITNILLCWKFLSNFQRWIIDKFSSFLSVQAAKKINLLWYHQTICAVLSFFLFLLALSKLFLLSRLT